MYKNNDFIYDASAHFEQLTGIIAEVQSQQQNYDAILTLRNIQFIVEAKSEVRKSNKGLVLSQLNHLKKLSQRPIVLIAKYIAVDIARELKDLNINYIDVSGNSYINEQDLFIYIIGQKSQKLPKMNQSRAFQETGIKLIFNLLKSPENLQLSYRELSKMTDVSIGSVSNVMQELESLSFILKTKTKRVLKNTEELIDRWIVAYNDVLRPRILKKHMRFNLENLNNWDTLPIQDIDNVNLWGGEPAAAILTGQLQPEKFTIYTNTNWHSIAKKFKLIPDENGNVEILQMFWKEEDQYREYYTAPKLLVYADLISSGHERNIQIAKELLYDELQDIE